MNVTVPASIADVVMVIPRGCIEKTRMLVFFLLVAGLTLLHASLVDNLVTFCGCGHNLVILFLTQSGYLNMPVT